MGAAGPMSLAAGLGSLKWGYVYPIPNLANLDENVDLLILTKGKKSGSVEHILINTFAFGGINVCLIISRCRE
jgi:3-oxoacyl-(acyl-carrier-protein) synthase